MQITMTKQDYRFSYDTIGIFQKLSNYYVNPSKRVGMDRVFLGLAGLLLKISLRAALTALRKLRLSLLFYLD